mmetsp:Transcript_37048/g.80643  ORF Transcript_37048/g.80643 Transcript_37048/m.80643 type:complete len:432 (-) Transcript_37048:88-1383(-)
MGNQLSQYNNRLTFDFDSYVRERDELAALFLSIGKDAAEHRQRKGTLQVVNGASGVVAGIAGAASLILAPVSMGASLPAGAAVTAATVGNSLTAASIASSTASYGFTRSVDRDIATRLHNLRHMIECIAKKDEEINSLLRASSVRHRAKGEGLIEIRASKKLCGVWEEWDLASDNQKKNSGFDLPLSIIKTQGIVFGTKSIIEGSKQMKEDNDIEQALTLTAQNLDMESAVLRGLESRFRYVSCITPRMGLPRGRLTYIDGGGGCSRIMVVSYYNSHTQQTEELKSDSSKCVLLPEGATMIKVHFMVKGNTTVKRVDRSVPGQPWTKSTDGKYETDVFDFDSGDGIDAAFVVRGVITHSRVEKAWDFGRHASEAPRIWEFWDNAQEECREVAPDIAARAALRLSDYEPCGMQLALCGACFEPDSSCFAQVA